jgi:hypothetical protein
MDWKNVTINSASDSRNWHTSRTWSPPNESAILFWNDVLLDSVIEVKHLSIGRVCDGFSCFYSSTFFPWVQNYVSIVNTSEGIFSRISGLENAQSLQSFLMWMNIWWQDASIIKRGSIITVLSSESIIRIVVPMESYLNKNKFIRGLSGFRSSDYLDRAL